MNNKNPIQIVGPVKQPVVAELPVQPKPRTEIMAAGGSGGQGVAGAQGSAAAQQQLVDAAAVAATQQGSVPVGPRGAANSQVEIGSNIQTPVAGSEQNTQKDTPTQTVPAPTSTPSGEKAYTLAELTALQEKETADDIYERYTLGKNFIRVGSGYTNTPNERTYRLAQPFDGMWYYDPGEKVYAGTPGSEAYFDENGNWKAPAGYAPQVGNSGSAGGTAGTSKFGNTGSSGSSLTALLEEWKKAAAEQANGQIDYAVAQAITELERALEDAQPAFREAAEAVSREEAQALDNSALYAELRGDKGGIGQSQYNEIQAAAAQNRLAVQQAQTKLATDTARQIADLRAQGEFEKADKALEITQTYLSQLISLEQWAAEFGFSQQQFQASLNQWQKEYELAMKKFDFEVESAENSRAAEIAYALLEQGIALTPEQLEALGMTDEQAAEWLSQQLGQPEDDMYDEYEMTYSQAKSLLDSGVYSEKAAMIYEAYAGVPYDFTGHQGILKEHLLNPAVKTAKWNIDQGVWRGKALVETIEEAVGNKVISEEEATALLKYAGLA